MEKKAANECAHEYISVPVLCKMWFCDWRSKYATYKSYIRYVLTNDDSVTWQDLVDGLTSSRWGDYIDHKSVRTEYIYEWIYVHARKHSSYNRGVNAERPFAKKAGGFLMRRFFLRICDVHPHEPVVYWSKRTVSRMFSLLQELGILEQQGTRRKPKWIVRKSI